MVYIEPQYKIDILLHLSSEEAYEQLINLPYTLKFVDNYKKALIENTDIQVLIDHLEIFTKCDKVYIRDEFKNYYEITSSN